MTLAKKRVYVSGYAALSAGGHDVAEHWQNLMAGKTCLQASADGLNALEGLVQNFVWQQALPDRKLQKLISKQDILGLYVAIAAMQQAGLSDLVAANPDYADKTGVFVGSPGNKYFQQYDFLPLIAQSKGEMQAFGQHLFEQVHPMWLLRILPNNVLAYAGILLGCKGINHNFTNHAVSGMQALIEAYWALQTGQADRILVVAYDLGQEQQAQFYYDKLGVIAKQGLYPFGQDHGGTVLAEGAAALVLETEDSLVERKGQPLAELMGGKVQSEGAGLFSIEDDGQSLAKLMQAVCLQQGIAPNAIDFLVAHGNGNQKSDNSEAQAIQAVFGPQQIPVTAFKWLMGHTLAASGLLDSVLALAALQAQCIPQLLYGQTVARGCEHLDLVAQHRYQSLAQVMVVNRGFASMDAVAVFKAV